MELISAVAFMWLVIIPIVAVWTMAWKGVVFVEGRK